MVVEYVIHIAAYGYRCKRGKEDLDVMARYPAVHNRQWIGINGSMWVHDSLQWITSWANPTCVVR